MKRFGSILALGYVIIFCWIKVQETEAKPTLPEMFDMKNTTEKMVSDYVSTTEQSPINNSSQEIRAENTTTKGTSSLTTEEPSKSNNNTTTSTSTSGILSSTIRISNNTDTSTTEKEKTETEIEVTNTTTTEYPDFTDEELGPNVYSVRIEYIRPDVIPIVVFDYDE